MIFINRWLYVNDLLKIQYEVLDYDLSSVLIFLSYYLRQFISIRVTLRKCLPINQFLQTLRNASTDGKLENKDFKTVVDSQTPIKLKTAVVAQKHIFVYRKSDDFVYSKLQQHVEFNRIDRFLPANYSSLAEFDQNIRSWNPLKWNR